MRYGIAASLHLLDGLSVLAELTGSSGIYVDQFTVNPLPPVTRLETFLRRPRFEATVARVAHGRRPSEHTRAIALEFDKLPGLTELVLSAALQWIPPAPPRPRPGRRSTPGLLRAMLGLLERGPLQLAS